MVSDEKNNRTWVFNNGRWLDKGEDDGQIIRDLVPVPDGKAVNVNVVKYRVSIHTGDKRGAGTDANVFIILHGDKGIGPISQTAPNLFSGDTGKRPLEGAGNNFERNRVDIFGVEAFDVGELTKITIGITALLITTDVTD